MMTFAEMQAAKLKKETPQVQEAETADVIGRMMMGQFVMKMFDARTSTHVAHLQSLSYAEHVALSGFYDSIVGLADGIVESWQGIYGELLQYPSPAPLQTDAKQCLTDLRDWITTNRYACCDDSEIQNEIDGVLSLINATCYKLKFLK